MHSHHSMPWFPPGQCEALKEDIPFFARFAKMHSQRQHSRQQACSATEHTSARAARIEHDIVIRIEMGHEVEKEISGFISAVKRISLHSSEFVSSNKTRVEVCRRLPHFFPISG